MVDEKYCVLSWQKERSFTLWRRLTSMSRLRNKQIDANKWQEERGKKTWKKQKNQRTTVGNKTDGLRESTRCCVGGLFNWWYHTSLSLFLSFLFSLFPSSNAHTHTHTLTLMHTIFALSPPYPCMTQRPFSQLLPAPFCLWALSLLWTHKKRAWINACNAILIVRADDGPVCKWMQKETHKDQKEKHLNYTFSLHCALSPTASICLVMQTTSPQHSATSALLLLLASLLAKRNCSTRFLQK